MPINKIRFFVFLTVSWFILLNGKSRLFADPVPTDVTVINKSDWGGTGYYSVADALRGLTTLNIERLGFRLTNAQAKLRGTSNSSRVIVLLDERPITRDNDSHIDLSQIPLSMLERIEIIEGGAPSAYSGEGVAGTIHLITQRPNVKGLDTTLATTIGRYGEKSVTGQFLGRSYWGDISYLASKETSGGYLENEQAVTSNHFMNLSRSFNGKGFWGLEYLYHDAQTGLAKGTTVPLENWDRRAERIPVDATSLHQETKQHVKGYLSVPAKHEGNFKFTWTETFQDSDLKPSQNELSLRDEDARSTHVDIKYDRRNFYIGGSFKLDRQKISPQDKNNITQEGLFLSKTWRNSYWAISPSMRWDHQSSIGNFLAPRLTVLHTPNDKLTFSSSLTRSYTAPTFEELFVSSTVVANSDLDAEHAWSGDLGVRYVSSKKTFLKVSGFFTAIDHVIQVNLNSNQWQNTGQEKNYGIETSASLGMGRKLTFSEQWIYQRSMVDSNDGVGYQQTAMTPMHLSFSKLKWDVSANSQIINEIRFKSKQYENNGKVGLVVPSFYEWNARFQIKILKADLFFAIENILNRRYAESLDISSSHPHSGGAVLSPQADRTYWTGASIRFLN